MSEPQNNDDLTPVTRQDLRSAVAEIKSAMPEGGVGWIGLLGIMFLVTTCSGYGLERKAQSAELASQRAERAAIKAHKAIEALNARMDALAPPSAAVPPPLHSTPLE